MNLIVIAVYLLAGLFVVKFFAKDGLWEDTEIIDIILPNILIALFWPVVLTIHLAFMVFTVFKIYTR